MTNEDQLCWLHFGDLQIRNREDENYVDFRALIDAANQNPDQGFSLTKGPWPPCRGR